MGALKTNSVEETLRTLYYQKITCRIPSNPLLWSKSFSSLYIHENHMWSFLIPNSSLHLMKSVPLKWRHRGPKQPKQLLDLEFPS